MRAKFSSKERHYKKKLEKLKAEKDKRDFFNEAKNQMYSKEDIEKSQKILGAISSSEGNSDSTKLNKNSSLGILKGSLSPL